ncbi:MAG: SIS domain-containing protein [Simkaniaceae bacterium]|nr:SIS domain-containing protein [Candidatus Sacchlamyda saccharinae]
MNKASLSQAMDTHILESVEEGIRAIQCLRDPKALSFIKQAAHMIADCFENKGKLIIAGNGGSLCDAMHFAEELTGVFREERKALPAIALSCPGHLTCTANDLGFEGVFSRGVEAYGHPGDIFVALTTSGNSQNLVEAANAAHRNDLKVLSFLGKTGGKLKGVSDLEWVVDGFKYSDRIQEAHMAAIHIIIEMVEKKLFHELA